MFVQCIWSVLWVCGCFATSLNEVEYDANCADNYDNEISMDQQEETPSVGPCQDDAPRWDKLFIALEDSHMRQNMLLSAVDQNCGGGLTPMKTLWEKLAKGGCHLCTANVEKTCKTQAEQMHSKLHQDFMEIMNYNIEMEKNLNLTLQHVLHRSHEMNIRLKRLEDGPKISPRPTLVTKEYDTTTTNSGLKEQEVENQWLDKGTIGKTLVTIATELQRIQLQLKEVMEEKWRKDRGDT
ncbi:hypothetical protein NQD34_016030 [Periophthalmus magnuspinnatus]|nr:hypothetical protein NQD34_016030 [Periophthalmus magnuspinnatus]